MSNEFDVERFITDVHSYRRRHNITPTELARRSEVGVGQIRTLLRRCAEPTLRTACALASVCDLSLDRYRKDVNINGRQSRAS